LTALHPFLLAGGLGALASALTYSVIWSAVELWRPQLAELWSGGHALGFTGVLLHFFGGTVLGLLFWLSWGLAGLVDVHWWERAMIFAVLAWTGLSMPAVLTTAFARHVSWQSSVALLTQWACTCLLTSVACAWTWEVTLTA
jgi:hypothetical protein